LYRNVLGQKLLLSFEDVAPLPLDCSSRPPSFWEGWRIEAAPPLVFSTVIPHDSDTDRSSFFLPPNPLSPVLYWPDPRTPRLLFRNKKARVISPTPFLLFDGIGPPLPPRWLSIFVESLVDLDLMPVLLSFPQVSSVFAWHRFLPTPQSWIPSFPRQRPGFRGLTGLLISFSFFFP